MSQLDLFPRRLARCCAVLYIYRRGRPGGGLSERSCGGLVEVLPDGSGRLLHDHQEAHAVAYFGENWHPREGEPEAAA